MMSNVTYKEFGSLVNFDKRFQGVDKSLQKTLVPFKHVSAEQLKGMATDEGDVKLLSTGQFDGVTTEEIAGEYMNIGEVISIPTGGAPSIKYYNGKFVDSGNILCVAKDETISLEYVFFALLANEELLARNFRGASIKHPQMDQIWKIKIPVPDVDEQRMIVKQLTCIRLIIASKKEQLSEYEKLVQSIFYDMFGDPIANPNGWEMKKLCEVVHPKCPISYGIVQPGDGETDGIPVVRPVDLRDCEYIHRFGLKCTTLDISNAYKRTILRGDELLICVRGTTGLLGFVSPELRGCNVTRGIVPLFFDEEVASKFFMSSVLRTNGIQEIIAEKTYGATLKQINIKDLREIRIPLPPLDLQKAFASKISAIEQQKELIRTSIAETEALLAARMQYYFD